MIRHYVMIQHYVRAEPREIIAGNVTHELVAILAWAMTTVTGESEIALRLLSAAPFVAGEALVTVRCRVRNEISVGFVPQTRGAP